jgi:Transglycosylase SLT domain
MENYYLNYQILEPEQQKVEQEDLTNLFSDFAFRPDRHFDIGSLYYANLLKNDNTQEEVEEDEEQAEETPEVQQVEDNRTHSQKDYDRYFDNVVMKYPEMAKYRELLTNIARVESGFNPKAKNGAGAPAYGYFQFMQDGGKYNNITAYAGVSIEEFMNDPELQIRAAHKLAQAFERTFTREDLAKAEAQGYTMENLLAGAWLGGVGGVRKALDGIDTDDRYWSSTGQGASVMEYMNKFK